MKNNKDMVNADGTTGPERLAWTGADYDKDDERCKESSYSSLLKFNKAYIGTYDQK